MFTRVLNILWQVAAANGHWDALQLPPGWEQQIDNYMPQSYSVRNKRTARSMWLLLQG